MLETNRNESELKIRPIEEVDPVFASLLKNVVEKNSKQRYVKVCGLDVFLWQGYWKEIFGDVVLPGRNDPCSCGSGKKFKKCCAP
jgi:uncharacterized protein YecA (UPF0149 family)